MNTTFELPLAPRLGEPPDEDQPSDPLSYLSVSRLKSFLSCRLKFYYEKVRGLRPPTSPNFQIGKAVEMRPGTDITIIACGPTVFHAVEASKVLAENDEIIKLVADTVAFLI